MRTVVQRVAGASVAVGGETVAAVPAGLLALIGIEAADTDADLAWTAEKIPNLRIFEDAQGKMNLSVKDLAAAGRDVGLLLVPNFTLAGDARKGRRPSFDSAMRPELAEPVFTRLVEAVRAHGVPVARGVFRAEMKVSLLNDGPITIWLDSKA